MTQKHDVRKTSKHGSKTGDSRMQERAANKNESIMRGRDKINALMARAGIKSTETKGQH